MINRIVSFQCDVCGNLIQLRLSREYSREEQWKQLVQDTWQDFLFWSFVGQPQYGEDQYWFDHRHRKVRVLLKGKRLAAGWVFFSIQVHDSVDGDEWLHVKAPIRLGRLDLSQAEMRVTDEPFNFFVEAQDERGQKDS